MDEQKQMYLETTMKKVSDTDINRFYFQQYIESYASKYTYKAMKRFLPIAVAVHKLYFENIDLSSLKIDHLINKSFDNKEYIRDMVRFIFYLNDINIELDKDILAFINIVKEGMTSSWSNDLLFDILCRPYNYYYFNIGKNKKGLFYINVGDLELIEILKEFTYQYSSKFGVMPMKSFTKDFADSLSIEPKLKDLNYETFLMQLNYYQKFDSQAVVSLVVSFYYFLGTNYNPDVFGDRGIKASNISRRGIADLLISGYDFAVHNPIEKTPMFDKWIFVQDNQNVVNSLITRSGAVTLNFTIIENETYRTWIKNFVWSNLSNQKPSRVVAVLAEFCNYLTALKSGKILSIYTSPTKSIDITANEVMAYKNMLLNKSDSANTNNNRLHNVKKFLSFINDTGLTQIPISVGYMLTDATHRTNSTPKCIPNEKLQQIAQLMTKKAEKSDLNKLLLLAFYIALETEFRISQILTLEVDCVRETNKPNEYVLVSKTKTSAGEEVEQPITIYVKRHIDEILKITQPLRDKFPNHTLSKYLFVYQAANLHSSYNIVGSHITSQHFRECCKELGIQGYNWSNLRDTHMTKAEEFVIRNQLSDLYQNTLSGHKSPTTDNKHYIDTNIKDLLESVHGIIVGDVDINGQIITTNSDAIKPENEVSHGCGYCGRNSCNEFTMLDCMMCKNFVTTPDRLPYFQEQVKILDYKIQNSTIPHDKEDLINIKRLYIKFIGEILSIKEDTSHE